MHKTKRDIVRSLNNVKIVLGNGFDLFCGLKTSYNDFFEDRKEQYNIFEIIKNNVDDKINEDANDFYENDINLSQNDYQNNTVWDFYFYLESPSMKETKWCDVEEKMKNSFRKESIFNWEKVLQGLRSKDGRTTNNEKVICCMFFLKYKYNTNFTISEKEFYDILFDELLIFERSFGDYIENQVLYNYKKYFSNCQNTLLKFSNSLTAINSISSFNYSNISKYYDWNGTMIDNINGDVKNPIFGIDSNLFSPLDIEYRFTKIDRRMTLDMKSDYMKELKSFDNLIFFGHSLNEQDYGYLFPLLDAIELNGNNINKKVVFAYYIYDKEESQEIKINIKKQVQKLIYEYGKSKGNNDNRLLERLWNNQRIILYEIDNSVENKLGSSNYYYNGV